jgi:hypothetical protein
MGMAGAVGGLEAGIESVGFSAVGRFNRQMTRVISNCHCSWLWVVAGAVGCTGGVGACRLTQQPLEQAVQAQSAAITEGPAGEAVGPAMSRKLNNMANAAFTQGTISQMSSGSKRHFRPKTGPILLRFAWAGN